MATLTTAGRRALPESDFALPGERYPIEDHGHARAALSEVSQHATPEEKAEVRRKVKSHFPDILTKPPRGSK